MHIEEVEIYSDESNATIMRHPGRHFPGILVQGDTLYTFCVRADETCKLIGRGSAAYDEANDLRNRLWQLLNHYKGVLDAHGIALPFDDAGLYR